MYKNKYLKYKIKYLKLKELLGGNPTQSDTPPKLSEKPDEEDEEYVQKIYDSLTSKNKTFVIRPGSINNEKLILKLLSLIPKKMFINLSMLYIDSIMQYVDIKLKKDKKFIAKLSESCESIDNIVYYLFNYNYITDEVLLYLCESEKLLKILLKHASPSKIQSNRVFKVIKEKHPKLLEDREFILEAVKMNRFFLGNIEGKWKKDAEVVLTALNSHFLTNIYPSDKKLNRELLEMDTYGINGCVFLCGSNYNDNAKLLQKKFNEKRKHEDYVQYDKYNKWVEDYKRRYQEEP